MSGISRLYKLVFYAPPLAEEGVAAWAEMAGADYSCDYQQKTNTIRYSLLLPDSMQVSGASESLAAFLSEWAGFSGFTLGEIDFRVRPVRSDWERAWKRHFRGRDVGRQFFIAPPGERLPEGSGRMLISIDPGPCFGTGHHPTTTLCLDYLEESSPAGLRILEPGCGSGILSIAAVLMGAADAFGFDIDPEAVAIARENAGRNGVADRTGFSAATLEDIPFSGYDLILLNMLPVHFLPHLDLYRTSFISPGGRMYFSGIHEEQRALVQGRLPEAGFSILKEYRTKEWYGFLCSP